MKAWCIFIGHSPHDDGAVLVYAHTRNDAKMIAFDQGPWTGCDYIDLRAWRMPKFDEHYNSTYGNYFERNEDLPKLSPKFFDDEAY